MAGRVIKRPSDPLGLSTGQTYLLPALRLSSVSPPCRIARITLKLLKSIDAHYNVLGCVLPCAVQVRKAAARACIIRRCRYSRITHTASMGPGLRIPEHAGRTGTRAVGVTIHLQEVDLLFRHHGSPATHPPTRAAICCEAERVVAAFPSNPPSPCVPFHRQRRPDFACLACLANGCQSHRDVARSAHR